MRAGLLQVPAGHQQARHLLALEVVDMAAKQEPVEQGPQRLVFGQVVGRREQRQQRELVHLGPAAVKPLVEHGQQVVEDRAIGVEELVQEDEFALGKHAGGHRGDRSFAEPDQVDRAEDLVRLGEPGQAGIQNSSRGPPWRIGGSRPTWRCPAVRAGTGARRPSPPGPSSRRSRRGPRSAS